MKWKECNWKLQHNYCLVSGWLRKIARVGRGLSRGTHDLWIVPFQKVLAEGARVRSRAHAPRTLLSLLSLWDGQPRTASLLTVWKSREEIIQNSCFPFWMNCRVHFKKKKAKHICVIAYKIFLETQPCVFFFYMQCRVCNGLKKVRIWISWDITS